jgi:flagellar basal-body rod protein FlgB
MFDSGAMPALDRLLQFTESRQRLLADNVANLSTPHFRPHDVSPESFHRALGEAIDRRRAGDRPLHGDLELRNTREMQFQPPGIDLDARPSDRNVLFHDRNNRDVERIMQDMAENNLTHNAAVQLLRSEYSLLEAAIRERP